MNWRYIFTIVLIVFFCPKSDAQNPGWIPPSVGGYSFSANLIAAVQLGDTPSNNEDDLIALFDENGEIRGLSTAIPVGNGMVIHFITMYSNQAIDTFDVKVYHQSTDVVYDVFEQYIFETQGLNGTIDNPYLFQIFPDNIPEFSLQNIPTQTTIESVAFEPINLAAYLNPIGNVLDTATVIFTYINNANLQVNLLGSILEVSGMNGFTGNTQLNVTAFITYNGTQIEAQTTITFNIIPLQASPLWLPKVPSQGIVIGNQFDSIPLHQYENQYEGPAILYDYFPIIQEEGTDSPPNWEVQTPFLHTMSVIAQINYTPKYHFHHEDDVFAFFADGQLRGVAYPNSQNGLYYITIGSTNNDPHILSLEFYSGAMRKFFSVDEVFEYIPYQIIGTDENPYIIDLAPIIPIIPDNPLAMGIYTMPVNIVDTSFIGTVTFTFTAKDPNYPNLLKDETNASFCIVSDSSDLNTYYEDYDQDGDGNPLISIMACTLPDGYSENGNDCNDSGINNELISTSILETSGQANDGFICQGSEVTITVNQMVDSYLWSTGDTQSSITINPMQTTAYQVTVTLFPGCSEIISDTIWVEQKIVRNSMNNGFNTLRNVLFCAIEGDTITYDLPDIIHSDLTAGIIINKSVHLLGSTILKPTINVDFNTALYGLFIAEGITLTLQNIDILTKNSDTPSIFTGSGNVNINGTTVVSKQ